MKKIFFALAALLTAAVACTEKEPNGGGESIVATYYLTSNQTEVLTLAQDRGRNVNLNVKTRESVGGEANLTFTLATDLTLVDSYNETNGTSYLPMPTEAFNLLKSSVTISRFGTNSTTAQVELKAKGLEAECVYVLPVTISEVTGGEYKLDEAGKTTYLLLALYVENDETDTPGSGSEGTGNLNYEFMTNLFDDPCEPASSEKVADLVVKTADDMMKIPSILVEGETKYVVLDADIDMAGKSWTPINTASPYTKGLEFNGKGHTIKNFTCNSGSYRSFYGIMYGRMYDVTFENPVIDGTAEEGTQPCAVIAGYGGNKSGMTEAYIYDVKVTGARVTAKAGGVGGLVGVATNTIVKRCSFDGVISNEGRRTGGIVGYHNVAANEAFLRIEDCMSTGSLTAQQNIGGILGQTQYSGKAAGAFKAKVSVVANCFSSMSLTGRNSGGIVGSASYGGSFAEAIAGDVDSCRDIIVKNIAWNTKIDATSTTDGNYSSGAVVGYCNIYQYFYDCYRMSSFNLVAPIADQKDATVKKFDITVMDQPNSGGDIKTLFDGTYLDETCSYRYQYAFPYHGKSTSNACATAKSLGWNESVWDLTGTVPALK